MLLLLEYFNLYSNQLTGTLPKDLRFRRVTYFDVGRNQLTGKIPEELGENMVTLRHLHLDHNEFRGTLPKEYNYVGNGRLESFSINHNRLTGTYSYCMCVYRCHAPRWKNRKWIACSLPLIFLPFSIWTTITFTFLSAVPLFLLFQRYRPRRAITL